ncbi:putative ankyrin repeat protein RF_0381 [Patella vulgata]|uniref:putative ankyrin repeat protein RF_0381 n=1 Tax=Patella vulgata TaxID=6465 RepID=UPI0024A90A5E|nr:putative ankyrin repeat protein RF_0381 [Patella vulgata]
MEPIRNSKTTITEILIQAGCDVNTPDKNGVTPLMECIQTNNQVLVKQLIGHGAFVNAKDNEGCFVLDYLFHSYHSPNDRSTSADTIKIMIETGADIHKCDNLLCRAIDGEDYETASLLIENGIDVNSLDDNGDNPLGLASEKGKLELVTLLTTNDCDINHQNQFGETALHKAISVSSYNTYYQDKEKIINTLLLQKGMNVNLSDFAGRTALSMAAAKGERSFTEVLMKAGAHIDHCDTLRETPLMIAKAGADANLSNGNGKTPLVTAARNTWQLKYTFSWISQDRRLT